ncbi:MAG: hypothetical protein HN380_09270 [Victivallales bacterium]|nr:hypothetical protein [Victivallales bacterium]
MKTLCRLLAVAILPLCAADRSDKRGGVCFRGDDNQTPAKWNQMRKVFDKHGFKLCAALNFTRATQSAAYIEFIRDLQAGGHEVMDHTPGHRVYEFQFAAAAEAAALKDKPFVHHVKGRTAYFTYRIDPVRSARRGQATVSGKSFRPADPAKFERWQGVPHLLFEDQPDTAYLLSQTKKGDFELRSFWGEDNIDLGAERTVTYRRLCKEDMRVEPDVLRLQAQVVQDLCKKHGIKPPTTWIQPGGYEAVLWRYDIAPIYGKEFGYTAGATYPDSAKKCFNEYDPDGDRRFAMQWGNFLEDKRDLEWNKTRIAEGVARHRLMVGHSHLNGPAELGGWQGTLERTEGILAWCKETGIPVRTMSEWADILYTQETDPTVNVFPDIGTDRDGNGRPDGIQLGGGVTVGKDKDGASLKATRDGVVCKVIELGGLEKGKNEFSLELVGAEGVTIELDVRFREVRKADHRMILVAADPAAPQRLACRLEIPVKASTADIAISAKGIAAGTGLRLRNISLSQPQP